MLTLLCIFGFIMTQVFGNITNDAEIRGIGLYFILLAYPAIKQDWSNHVDS